MNGGPRDTKAQHYAREDVARHYEARRFGSRAGAWVDRRELDTVVAHLSDLPRDAHILDVPVGTGRLLERLVREGFTRAEGADASPAMIEQARRRCGPGVRISEMDAFHLGFPDASLDAVVCLRLLFHFADVRPLLRELARVLRPGGVLVADVLSWSPRAVLPLLQKPFGGPTHTLSRARADEVFTSAGLRIVAGAPILILPSFAYRFVPGGWLPGVVRMEEILPGSLRSKVVYRAVRR